MSEQTDIFMRALFGSQPDDQFILLRTLTDKCSRWLGDLEECLDACSIPLPEVQEEATRA